MLTRIRAAIVAVAVSLAFPMVPAGAQTAVNLLALEGLAPVTALGNTDAGKAALAANLAITAAIQDGTAKQPTLLPFPGQQEQSLRDAFIAGGNVSDLADGLGTSLGDAYRGATSYTRSEDGKSFHFTNISPAIARLFAYALATERSDSDVGKYFFANATVDKVEPASPDAMAILKRINGMTDVFGKAYGLPAGSKDANRYGNSRPFQTERRVLSFEGKDFWGFASSNTAYLRGPTQNLTDSPSYPSGHTAYGYTGALLFALLMPERYQQMVTRGAEYGNDRIIIGAHYAMDVLGGRTLAMHDLAQLLANKPGYIGVERRGIRVDDFQEAFATAKAELTKALEVGCGDSVAACAAKDQGRFASSGRNQAFYESTQTYGLPVVFAQNAPGPEDTEKLAPEAGYLLTMAFPELTLAQANDILTTTEGPGGGFLDNGSSFGVYSRLNLYKAAEKALALSAAKRQNAASR